MAAVCGFENSQSRLESEASVNIEFFSFVIKREFDCNKYDCKKDGDVLHQENYSKDCSFQYS
jgi:hypothetical protein